MRRDAQVSTKQAEEERNEKRTGNDHDITCSCESRALLHRDKRSTGSLLKLFPISSDTILDSEPDEV